MSEASSARVLIPKNAMSMIQTIRDTTGKKHSDEQIYVVLKECDMDPNETVEKLLYIDTFHEVKKKPNRQNRVKETVVPQRRGTRGARGNYSSNHKSSDVGGGSNAFVRRDNGNYRPRERGSFPSSLSAKEKNNADAPMTKGPDVVSNGPANLSNGSSSQSGYIKGTKDDVPITSKQSSAPTVAMAPTAALAGKEIDSVSSGTLPSVTSDQEKSLPSSNQSSTSSTVSVAGIYSSASDPVLDVSLLPRAGVVGAIKRRQQEAAEINHVNLEEALPNVQVLVPSENAVSISKATEPIESSAPPEPSPPKAIPSKVANDTTKDDKLLSRSNASDDQHVTFPTHFQVSEALKTGLTFGSFDPSFGLVKNHNNDSTDNETTQTQTVESFQGSDEIAGEPSPSNQSVSSSTEQGDNAERPQTPPMFEKVPQSDSNIQSTTADLNIQSIEDLKLQAESNLRHNVQYAPSHNIGLMPPLSTSNFLQLDGSEMQTRDVPRFPNFNNGNPPAPSSSPAPLVPSSVATQPQPVPLFRHPFHPSYFPYGHYLSPFLMPPMHQFITPNGLPQQPTTGSVYLPPGAPASGFKLPLPPFMTGTNAGTAPHLTIPSAYGPFSTPHVGFNPVPAPNSAGSTSKEDLAASQLKENHVYTTGPVSEGPGLWMPSPGQDMSNLPLSSFYNLSVHGQPVAFSPAQAGHGAFAGLYQTPQQTMAAPSNMNSLLQSSQPTAATTESVGPPNAYQQPQLQQVNWNNGY